MMWKQRVVNSLRYSMASLLIAACCSSPALAVDGLTITGGDWEDRDDRYGYRIAPRWNWSNVLYTSKNFSIKGYWEASVGHWQASNLQPGENDSLWILAASPMIQFHFSQWHSLIPFFELGIGASAMTKDSLGSQDLGSKYHFEDKFGFGLSSATARKFEVSYRYFHYSNASISTPNDGLDFHTLNFSFFFK